jgi:WD40 repeat protein
MSRTSICLLLTALRRAVWWLAAPLLVACAPTASFIAVTERIDVSKVSAEGGHLATEPMLRLGDDAFAGTYNGLATDARGRYLVTVSTDKTAKVWSIDGRLLLTLRPPSGDGAVGSLDQAALSPDGNVVALGWRGPKSASIYLFDRATGRVLRHLDGLPNVASSLRFSPGGTQLAAAIVSGGVVLFDASSGREIARDLQYGGDSYSVDFSRDGRRLVVPSLDGNLRLYAVGPNGLARIGMALTRQLAGSGQPQPMSARFSPDGRWIAAGYKTLGGVGLYDASNLSLAGAMFSFDLKSNVFALDWMNDSGAVCGHVFLSSSRESVIRCWYHGDLNKPIPWNMFNVTTRDTLVPGHASVLFGPLALPGGGMVVATQSLAWGIVNDGRVEWRHEQNAATMSPFAITPMRPRALALSADGESVIVGNLFDEQAAPLQFDVRTRTLMHGLAAPLPPRMTAPGMAFSADEVYRQSGRAGAVLNGHVLPLNPSERASVAATDANGTAFVLGTTEELRLYDRNAQLRWRLPGMTLSANISDDGRWVVARGSDQIIRWVRASDGQLALSLYVEANSDRWIAWTPSGFFDAAPGSEDLVGWQVNQGLDAQAIFYPLSHFRSGFQRPDLIARVLETSDERQALKLADAVSQRISVSEPVAQTFPPRVVLIDAPRSFDSPDVQIRVHVTAPANAPVEQIRVRVNGKFDPTARGKLRSLEGDQTLHLTLPRADAVIEIFAVNRNDSSDPVSVALAYRPGADTSTQRIGKNVRKPRLFLLAVGVSDYGHPGFNLNYANADARDFARLFEAQRGHHYASVASRVLTDKEATREHVLAAFKWLGESAAESDVAIVFLAGHGVQLPDGSYHFATSDFDPDNVRMTSVDDDSIRKMLGDFAGRGNDALLFVDTCHAGAAVAANVRESSGDRNSQILQGASNNVVVFAASSENKLSFEDESSRHGAFTKVLLDALADWKADPYHSGEITHADLSAYVQKFLPSLTPQRQTPRVFTPLGGAEPFVIEAR